MAKLEASSYVEIIGSVTDSSTVKYMASIDLGPEFGTSRQSPVLQPFVNLPSIDLKIANDVIEMAHDREFQRHFSAKDDDPESMQF